MAARILVALAGLALLAPVLAGCVGQPSAAPSATTTAPPVQSASPTPAVTAAPEPLEATCENTSTAEFQAMMSENEWVSWSRRDGTGWPFGEFPGGAPAGNLACTWGADPDLGTDNVITIAWAPISADAASAAQTYLESAGFDRINAPEGVYLAQKGEYGWADAEGYGASYLFTADDVRWAMFKGELGYVKAPDEAG